MGFRGDFIKHGSGTECPEVFLQWAGLSVLGAVLGRKVWTMHGDHFPIYPKLYVCLVGDAGSGKSTAKDYAKRILREVRPDYLTSASFQSHQDIIDMMANDTTAINHWKHHETAQIHEYRAFYAICNELASMLSTDKKGMVEFLVDVYDDSDDFKTGYKGQRKENPERKQVVPFPYVSVLACAVPKWFMGNLKLDLFDGGLGRRLIVVYANKSKLVPNPKKTADDSAAWQRAIAHLRTCASEACQGELKKTEAAQKWWDEWYMDPKRFDLIDPIISQFHQTKHTQVLKVAMLLAKSDDPAAKWIEIHHLVTAEKMLTNLEPQVRHLTSGIGRNELAGIGAQLIEFITRTGGMQTEVNVKKNFFRYANNPEFLQIIEHHKAIGDLFHELIPQPNGTIRSVYMTVEGRETFRAMQAETLRIRENTQSSNDLSTLPKPPPPLCGP